MKLIHHKKKKQNMKNFKDLWKQENQEKVLLKIEEKHL